MPSRTSWEGYLKISLLSVPVKAYTATVTGKGRIGFHLLHAKCHSRIRYKKVCPIHGEVSNDEIVSGYEQEKDQYVVVEKEELARLKPDADKAIDVEVFIDPVDLDPVYFTDRTYYLVPDGRVAAKSYTVLQQVMAEQNRYAIATMVFSGKEQLVCVRPTGRLLAVSFLSYSDQIKSAEEFDGEVPEVDVPAKEAELARGLIEASMAEKFDLGTFRDRYAGDVLKMLEAKAGRKGLKRPAAATAEDKPAVVNLMDALRESLREVKRATGQRKRRASTSQAVTRPRRRKAR